MFVSHGDIRQIESLRHDTLLAVKAPFGTRLEVPRPDDAVEVRGRAPGPRARCRRRLTARRTGCATRSC